MIKQTLMRSASRLAQFRRQDEGAVAVWFAILLVPMLGMTFAAIKYSQYAGHRSGMLDAMDAAGLGLARQFEFEDLEACDLADGADGVDDPNELSGQERARLERYARGFFEENYPEYTQLYGDEDLSAPLDLATDMTFSLTCAAIRIETDAYADMSGVLGKYFGVKPLPVNLSTEISLPGSGRVEIALVLDVTGSMSASLPDGETRISKLRDAVDTMLDDPNMYGPNANGRNDFVRMSVVPFNTMVNVGPDYSGTAFDGSRTDEVGDWIDSGADALYHGTNYFHAVEGTLIEGKSYYDDGGVPEHTTSMSPRIVVDADGKVNHFTLFNSVGQDGASWKGCVEARPYPLDEVLAPPGLSVSDIDDAWDEPDFVQNGSDEMEDAWDDMVAKSSLPYTAGRREDTRFVPFFYGDEPECALVADLNGDGDYNEYGETSCNYIIPPTANERRRAFLPSWWKQYDFVPAYFFYDLNGDTSASVSDYYRYNRLYPNDSFIDERTFTYPFPNLNANYASNTDFERYRNLVFDMHEHLSASGGASSCWGGSFEYPYSLDANMTSIISKLGITNCIVQEYKLRQAYVGVYKFDGDGYKYYGKYENTSFSNYDPADDISTNYTAAGVGPTFTSRPPRGGTARRPPRRQAGAFRS